MTDDGSEWDDPTAPADPPLAKMTQELSHAAAFGLGGLTALTGLVTYALAPDRAVEGVLLLLIGVLILLLLAASDRIAPSPEVTDDE